MSAWKELNQKHKEEKVALIVQTLQSGMTISQAARELDISRQQLHQFCKINHINVGGNDES